MAKKLKQLTERMKTEIVPTPGNDKGQNVSYKNIVQGGEKAFVDKHVVQKTDYPVPEKNAGDKNAMFSGAKQTKKKRLADQENEAGDKMYEAKVDAIMASLKANKSDFVKSHGHNPIQSDVNPEEEVWIDEEEVWVDEYELKDGSLIDIDEETMSILDEVYESLSEDHQDQFDILFSENRETNTNLLEWVRSVA